MRWGLEEPLSLESVRAEVAEVLGPLDVAGSGGRRGTSPASRISWRNSLVNAFRICIDALGSPGLTRRATREAVGTISLRSSSVARPRPLSVGVEFHRSGRTYAGNSGDGKK